MGNSAMCGEAASAALSSSKLSSAQHVKKDKHITVERKDSMTVSFDRSKVSALRDSRRVDNECNGISVGPTDTASRSSSMTTAQAKALVRSVESTRRGRTTEIDMEMEKDNASVTFTPLSLMSYETMREKFIQPQTDRNQSN